jgi:hypothetical protein
MFKSNSDSYPGLDLCNSTKKDPKYQVKLTRCVRLENQDKNVVVDILMFTDNKHCVLNCGLY